MSGLFSILRQISIGKFIGSSYYHDPRAHCQICSERNSNWEGAFRDPDARALAGQDQAWSKLNKIVQHHDWLPTFLAMAGNSDGVEKLKSGYQAIGRTYKNHIDGYDLLPYLTGEALNS